MAELRTRGIILGSQVHGEADQLVTLFTPGQGKLRAQAKNAKKSKKRFMNCLDDYGLVQLVLVRKAERPLDLIDSCRLLARPPVGADPLKLGLAGLGCEAVRIFFPEGQPDQDLFVALQTFLFSLEESDNPAGLGLAFLIRLLHQAGFGPNLETCLQCGQELDNLQGAVFDHLSGGVTCKPCSGHDRHISLGGLKTIRLCQQISPSGLNKIRFPAQDQDLIFDLTADYLAHTAGRELKSLGFLRKLGWRRR